MNEAASMKFYLNGLAGAPARPAAALLPHSVETQSPCSRQSRPLRARARSKSLRLISGDLSLYRGSSAVRRKPGAKARPLQHGGAETRRKVKLFRKPLSLFHDRDPHRIQSIVSRLDLCCDTLPPVNPTERPLRPSFPAFPPVWPSIRPSSTANCGGGSRASVAAGA